MLVILPEDNHHYWLLLVIVDHYQWPFSVAMLIYQMVLASAFHAMFPLQALIFKAAECGGFHWRVRSPRVFVRADEDGLGHYGPIIIAIQYHIGIEISRRVMNRSWATAKKVYVRDMYSNEGKLDIPFWCKRVLEIAHTYIYIYIYIFIKTI